MSNTKIIARNTGWYGLESAISFIVTLFTSIAIARILGPSKMGYIIYVSWIASVVSSLGGIGIPATTRKYMAEFIGMGDRGTARYIYLRTLLFQFVMATIATGAVVFWVLKDAGAEYAVASVLVALSIWPAMVNAISAQANVAMEELSRNLPASVISILIFFAAIAATVMFSWGVVGVGTAVLMMRSADFFIRFFPTLKHILAWGAAHIRPAGLTKRMITFAWQSVASMIVALIVWERSEFFLLRNLCSDIRQVAYYSVAFSMAERLLVSASVFGSAAAATIFAQYGRDKSRLPDIVASSFRYLILTSLPLHAISSALAIPALILLYGSQYKGAAMVVTLAPLLCMPKAFISPVQSLLQSMERQSYVIAATILAGFVDIGVAWYLIPTWGAVGACIGSGAAQLLAVASMWGIGIYIYEIRLAWLQAAKVVFISVLSALTAHYIAVQFSPLWGILSGGSASLVILVALFYLMHVLETQDLARLAPLIELMPKPIANWLSSVLLFLTRPSRMAILRKATFASNHEGRVGERFQD